MVEVEFCTREKRSRDYRQKMKIGEFAERHNE
jgi:hypothetical protein